MEKKLCLGSVFEDPCLYPPRPISSHRFSEVRNCPPPPLQGFVVVVTPYKSSGSSCYLISRKTTNEPTPIAQPTWTLRWAITAVWTIAMISAILTISLCLGSGLTPSPRIQSIYLVEAKKKRKIYIYIVIIFQTFRCTKTDFSNFIRNRITYKLWRKLSRAKRKFLAGRRKWISVIRIGSFLQLLIIFALVAATLAEEQATETKKDKRGIYGGYGGYGYSSYAAPISQAVSVVTKEVPVPVPHPVAVPVEKHVPVPVKVKIILPFPFYKKEKKNGTKMLRDLHDQLVRNLW